MSNDRELEIGENYRIAKMPGRRRFALYSYQKKFDGSYYETRAVFKTDKAAHDFMDFLLGKHVGNSST